ncbi:MAG: histidine kinase [Chitinophagaceae bacterium]
MKASLYIWFAGLLLTGFVATAQIPASQKAVSKVAAWNQRSAAFIKTEQKDSAAYYAELARQEALQTNDTNGLALALLHQARIVKHFDDNFRLSEQLSRQAMELAELIPNNPLLKQIYFDLIFALGSQSRFGEAELYTNKQYELCKKLGDADGMFDALCSLFALHKDAGDYEQAFYFVRTRRQLALESGKPYWVQSAFISEGELDMKVDDYAAALENYRQAIQLDNPSLQQRRQQEDFDIWFRMEYAEIFSHLLQFDSAWHYYELYKPSRTDDRYYRVYLVSTGEYYFLRKEYNMALDNFQRGLLLHQQLNDRNEIQRTLVFIAKTCLALSRENEALQYARQGLELAGFTKAKQIARDCYQVMYTAFDRKHQSDSANVYFRKWVALNEAVGNEKTRVKMAVASYEQKIALLDKEKLLQEQILLQSKQQKRFLLAGIGVVIILALALLSNILLKRKNQAHRIQLAETELALQKEAAAKASAALQQKAIELEMQALRSQMNPHFIFNSLNAINRFVLQNNQAQASEYLTKFSKLVRMILQNSQAALITLDSELEALRLYLELEAIRFNHRFDFTIHVATDLDADTIKVPPLVIQPYAENAIWHGLMQKAAKGSLSIALYEEDDQLCCCITDDGIGREKAAALKSKSAITHKSMGMKLTASRIELLHQEKACHAHIHIEDLVLPDGSPGGTRVLLKFPLQYD